MRFTYKTLSFGIFFLLVMISASATTNSIKLLTVNLESDVGSVATLKLETRYGSGRVFIEANLLSNEDTQFSIKLAKEIVCNNFNFNCEGKDFFYTIESDAPTVTGPSGGAGMALLTYANLAGKIIPEDISITGTINSGGFVGNVGGVKEKIIAANNKGLNKVFIPIGNKFFVEQPENITNSTNISQLNSTDLVEFGETIGIEVVNVGTLEEILSDLFYYKIEQVEVEVPDFYFETMREISDNICKRSNELKEEIGEINKDFEKLKDYYEIKIEKSEENITEINSTEKNVSNKTKISEKTFASRTNVSYYMESAEKLMNSSVNATLIDNYYASASYCFGASLKQRYILFLSKELNDSLKLTQKVIQEIERIQVRELNSLNEIQIYAVVQERLDDAKESFESAKKKIKEGKILDAIDKLAYSYERANTAKAWSRFYDKIKNEELDLSLDYACSITLKDAEAQINYLRLYWPLPFNGDSTIELARKSQSEADYPMCVFYSLKAKAEADLLTSAGGANEENFQDLLEVKKEITSRIIGMQIQKGKFPILGYSYLEYGTNLQQSDPYASLLYYQLAQEQSNLNVYFDTKQKQKDYFWLFLFTSIIFAVITLKFIEH